MNSAKVFPDKSNDFLKGKWRSIRLTNKYCKYTYWNCLQEISFPQTKSVHTFLNKMVILQTSNSQSQDIFSFLLHKSRQKSILWWGYCFEKVSEVVLTLTHMHTILTNFYEAIDLLIDKTFRK